MENAHAEQIPVLSHHLEDDLGILGIAYAHRIVNASFNGLQKEIGALPCRIDQLSLFPLQIDEGVDADAESKEDYRDENNPVCQALENQHASLG
jgi:hypothetical protein